MKCERRPKKAWLKKAESIPQSSYQKSSLTLGEARRHLKSCSSSVFLRGMQFAPKTSLQFISDCFFYIALAVAIATTLWQLHIFSDQPRSNIVTYDEIGRIFSERLHSELRSNPEFAALMRGAL
jgi:hypothetical protein